MEKEHLKPEFLKINPEHTIPTFVDKGFAIWESRAILGYLVEKYGKDDSLYPKDPQRRAVVNQRLYFDMGTLYKSFTDYFFPQFKLKQPADPEKFKKMEEAVKLFDDLLFKTKYAAGDKFTIADYSLVASFSALIATGYDYSRFTNITRWYNLCKSSLPGIEINEEGIEKMKEFMKKFKDQ